MNSLKNYIKLEERGEGKSEREEINVMRKTSSGFRQFSSTTPTF